MTFAPSSVRRVELALWYVGLALLGFALGATYDRWRYQFRQERALFAATSQHARSVAPLERPREAVARQAGADLFGPLPLAGPPALVPEPQQRAGLDRTVRTQPPVVAKAPVVDPTVFGRIEIPRIGVKAIVREGADEKTLARAVGLIPGGARPGQAGNIILAGHRDTFFRPLRDIRVDDRIRIVGRTEVFDYRVDSIRIVAPEETSVLASRGHEELTLVTCFPFRFIGPAPDRFIVSATRVQ